MAFRPLWAIRTAQVLGACVAVAIVLAVAVHLPPVRQAALRYVIGTLADRFDVALRAERLDYNLAAMRASLSGVEVARVSDAGTPFFTADRVDVEVPFSTLLGRVFVDRLAIGNARFNLLRRADGTTNLPQPEGGEPGAPAALPIGRLQVSQLAVSVVDEVSAVRLELPALALDVATANGTVRSDAAGRFEAAGVTTAITSIAGGLAFDGRTLRLTELAVATGVGTATADGTLALLVQEPRADLRLSARTALASVARFAPDLDGVAGPVAIDGTLTGPLADPAASMRLHSDTLTWRAFELSPADVSAGFEDGAIRVTEFAAGVAGGRINGTGTFEIAPGRAEARLSWSEVDLAVLARSAALDGPRPSARMTGSMTLNGAGNDIGNWSLDARTRFTPGPGGRGRLPLEGNATVRAVAGAWSVDADTVVAGTPVAADLDGRLDAGQLAASTLGGRVAVSGGELSRLLDSLREAGLVDVEPSLAAGALNARADLAGTFARPRFEATLSVDEGAAAGVTGVAARVTATGTPQQVMLDGRVTHDGNEATATGRVSANAGLDLRVQGTVRDARRLAPGVPVTGVATFDLQVAGPFNAATVEGDVTVADAAYDGVAIGPVESTVRLDARRALIKAMAAELATSLEAEVELTGARLATVSLRTQGLPLERLTGQIELPAPLSGTVALQARATAPLDDWRRASAVADVTTVNAKLGELPVQLASPSRLTFEGLAIDVAGLEATVGEMRLSVAGRLPLDETAARQADDGLRAQLAGDAAEVLPAVRAAGFLDRDIVEVRGPLMLAARVDGSLERPVLSGSLDVTQAEVMVPDVPAFRLPELHVTVANGWIDRLTASGEWQGSRIEAQGRSPLQVFRSVLPGRLIAALPQTDGVASLDARFTSITPDVVAPFVDPDTLTQIAGVVEASLRLETTSLDVADLRGELRLDRLDVAVAELPVAQTEPTRITFDRGLAQVAAWRWTGGGATLDIQGEIGLTDQRAALLAAGQLDLRVLSPFLRSAGASLTGTLGTRVSVSGSLSDPHVDGEATVSGGEIRLREPRVVASGINGFAVLTPTGMRLTSLDGAVNGGTFTGGGDLTYGGGDAAGRFALRFTGMGLEFPEGLRSELDGDLVLALEQKGGDPGGRVSGTVTLVRGAYREPLAVVTGLLTQLRTAGTVAQAGPDAFASRLALDVRLVTDSDVIVDNNLARLQLGGDLRLIGTAAAPALSGRAELREGGQLFLGSNVYRIDNGIVDFTDPTAIVPTLSVQATTRAGGHDIEISLTGPPSDLAVVPQSLTEPELGQSDVTSLLLTGRKLDDVPGAAGEIVAQQIVGYLSGDVLGVASRAIGLDTIRIGGPDSSLRRDPAAIASEADPTSRLTFAKIVGNNIEITYSQSLREGDAQTWIVDYRPVTQVNLRFVSDDDDLRSYEFRHDVMIGGGSTQQRRAARPAPPETRVVAVTITGDMPVAERRLRRALRLSAGDRFDFVQWQRDRDRLEALLHRAGYLEARVAARRIDDEAGVQLAYEIEGGPATTIEVSGYQLSTADRRRIEEAWSQAVFDEFLREEAGAIVRSVLTRDGYLEPRIETTIAPVETQPVSESPADRPPASPAPAGKLLTVAVDPGERVQGRQVVLTATDEDLQRELDAWLEQQDLDAAWEAPERLSGALRDELRARGYLAARVTIGVSRVSPGVAALQVAVDPGSPFTIADVRISGATRLDPARVRDAATLAPGDLYLPSDVDRARDRVDALYRRDGFATARVTAATQVDEAARSVTVAFTIDEGPRQVLREIQVRGNRGVDTGAIEQLLDLQPGEPLADDAWVKARARLFDTGVFRRADVRVEPIDEAVAADERPSRLVATVEEWPALRVRYGLALSEERPEDATQGRNLSPGLSADVTRRTLFGRAIGIGAAVEYRRRERLARVFLNAPTMFGLPIESLFSVERWHREFADTDSVTNLDSVSWEQRVRRGALQLSYAYRFERDHTFETGVPDDPFLPPFDVSVNIARINGSAVFDTRDDPTRTSRGWLLSTSLELSPVSLKSDVAFVQQVSQALHFREWGRVVLASAGRFGIISPLADQPLIPSLLFFAGGPRTVRGVAEANLGPRDVFGDPAGGRALLVMNQEVRFPVYRWFGGVGFIDAGNVFREPRDFDLGRLVTTFGAGLRIDTPFALLRIDYGRRWLNGSGHRLAEWTFGIGHTF